VSIKRSRNMKIFDESDVVEYLDYCVRRRGDSWLQCLLFGEDRRTGRGWWRVVPPGYLPICSGDMRKGVRGGG
jgi:hypothetical protein